MCVWLTVCELCKLEQRQSQELNETQGLETKFFWVLRLVLSLVILPLCCATTSNINQNYHHHHHWRQTPNTLRFARHSFHLTRATMQVLLAEALCSGSRNQCDVGGHTNTHTQPQRGLWCHWWSLPLISMLALIGLFPRQHTGYILSKSVKTTRTKHFSLENQLNRKTHLYLHRRHKMAKAKGKKKVGCWSHWICCAGTALV